MSVRSTEKIIDAEPARPLRAQLASAQPLRVGFILHEMQVAGAEVLVAEAIRYLDRRIQPTVFCLDKIGALGEQLRSRGIDVISFGRRPGFDLRVAWQIACEARKRRIEILHAHQYTPFFYAALARVLTGIGFKVILTEHGRHYPDFVSRRRRLANRWLLQRLANEINAVCEFSAVSLSERDGFPSSRITVIENGIELSRFSGPADRAALRRRVELQAGRRYIVNIARFHPVKDQATLIRGFSEIASAYPDVDLLLVGDGPLRSELEHLARSITPHGRVLFLGVRSDVAELLRASDLFVLSSKSEAASLTLLEAMAAGLPIVATAVGGTPEIVRHHREGLLVPRQDAASLACAIKELLENPLKAASMGRAALSRVRDHYRIELTIQRYYALYAKLAKR